MMMEGPHTQQQVIAAVHATPLIKAATEGDAGYIKTFFSSHTSINVNAALEECPYGETLLHYAAYNGREACLAVLLSLGANPSVVGTSSTATPIHSAAAGGHL